MKKRLLSAALALAMVLTLLPLTVFAALPTVPTTVYYYAQGAKPSDAKADFTNASGGWFIKGTTATDGKYDYEAVGSNGVVNTSNATPGNGTSATWYTNLNGDALKQSSLTLLTDGTLDVNAVETSSMTVNVNGKGLILSSGSSGVNKLTSLTVIDTDRNTDGTGKGSVTSTSTVTISGRSFSFTNGNSTGKDGVAKPSGSGSNAVAFELDNSSTENQKRSDTLTVNVYGGEVGAITTKYAKANITVNNGGKAGAITLGTATEKGSSSSTSKSGGTIKVSNGTLGTVGIYGTCTDFTVEQMSTVDAVTLYGGAASTNNPSDSSKTPTWAGTTMTVKGGSTVTSIAQANSDEIGHNITINNSTVTSSIDLTKDGTSTVKLENGAVVGGGTSSMVKMKYGTLSVKSSTVKGDIEHTKGADGTLSIEIGTKGSTTDQPNVAGEIKASSSGQATGIVINGGNVGTITANTSFTVNGGTIGTQITAATKNNLAPELRGGYQIKTTTGQGASATYTYTAKFQDLIDAYRNKGTSTIEITPVGESNTTLKTVTFRNDVTNVELVQINVGANGFITLPTEVNGQTVSYWYDVTAPTGGTATKEGIPAGTTKMITDNVTYAVQRTQDSNHQITKITAIDKNRTSNNNIGCKLSGTTISLSGAIQVKGTAGSVEISIEIDNAAVASPKPIVGWEPKTKTIQVGKFTDANGISWVNDTTIKIYDTQYTIVDGGLAEDDTAIAINVPITAQAEAPVVTSDSAGLSGDNTALGKLLKTALVGGTVDFSNASGIVSALNAIKKSANADSILTEACNAQLDYIKTTDPNTKQTVAALKTTYKNVEMTPYLEISASNYKATSGNDEITLDIKLMYRYKVHDGGSTKQYALNKDGTVWQKTAAMSVPAEECGRVDIKLVMPDRMFTAGVKSWAHHNGYVYELNWATTSGSEATTVEATINNVNGFSSFVINNTEPMYQIKNGNSFDTLQQAVDASKNNDIIYVKENFKGTINVTGSARRFYIQAIGGSTVALDGAGAAEYTMTSNLKDYTIELKKDVVVNAAIGVNTAANGTASAGVSTAKQGDTVSGTIKPDNGYKAGAFTATAKKSDGTSTSVSVSVNAAANTFSFTVPKDATSVTVTPSFIKADALPFTDVATTDSYYTAVKWNYDNNYIKGTTETTFRPFNYLSRAQIVTILYRNAGSPSVNTNVNLYSDINGPDVDAEMRSAIVWATNTAKIVNGYGDGRFGPSNNVRNQELAKILYLYNSYRGKAMGTTSLNLNTYFSDASSISAWAKPYVQWAVGNGVMSFSSGTQFQPQMQLQRWQAAVDVYNYGMRFGA